MDGIVLLILCCPWILWVFIGGIFTYEFWGIITGIFNLLLLLFIIGGFALAIMSILAFFSAKNEKAKK